MSKSIISYGAISPRLLYIVGILICSVGIYIFNVYEEKVPESETYGTHAFIYYSAMFISESFAVPFYLFYWCKDKKMQSKNKTTKSKTISEKLVVPCLIVFVTNNKKCKRFIFFEECVNTIEIAQVPLSQDNIELIKKAGYIFARQMVADEIKKIIETN